MLQQSTRVMCAQDVPKALVYYSEKMVGVLEHYRLCVNERDRARGERGHRKLAVSAAGHFATILLFS